MKLVKTLIDKWRETRTQRELAQLMGVREQRLSNWKGGEPMSEAQFAKLAELVVGIDQAKALLWEFVHQKQREGRAAVQRMSDRFKSLLLRANPRGGLFFAG